jgi:hypothetical protein
MRDPAQQLISRDRLRRKLAEHATPEERVRDLAQLQEATWVILRSSPAGYAHFLRRNFKARAIEVRDPNADEAGRRTSERAARP